MKRIIRIGINPKSMRKRKESASSRARLVVGGCVLIRTHLLLIALITTVSTVTLTGCSSPPHQSTVAESTYYQSKNPAFRVRVPRLAGAYSLSDITIEEQASDNAKLDKAVAFVGPGDDPEVYRVRIFKTQSHGPAQPPFLETATQVRADLVHQAEWAYDAILTKFDAQQIAVNGHDALVAVYRQAVKPPFTLSGGTRMRMRYHAMYFVDYGPKMAVFWIETPSDAWGTGADQGDKIASHRVSKINRFLSSFEWVPDSPQAAVLTGSVSPQPSDNAD